MPLPYFKIWYYQHQKFFWKQLPLSKMIFRFDRHWYFNNTATVNPMQYHCNRYIRIHRYMKAILQKWIHVCNTTAMDKCMQYYCNGYMYAILQQWINVCNTTAMDKCMQYYSNGQMYAILQKWIHVCSCYPVCRSLRLLLCSRKNVSGNVTKCFQDKLGRWADKPVCKISHVTYSRLSWLQLV
jgi:hypothetical protein